jgi:hypothetical protein
VPELISKLLIKLPDGVVTPDKLNEILIGEPVIT